MHTRIVALILFAFSGLAHASVIDDISVGYSPRTGDMWVDARLRDVNVFASGNRDGFVDEVVVSTGAPQRDVYRLLDQGWAPGDVYFACLLARQLQRSCDNVATEYERDRANGWGALAKRLGIRPGSDAFHALKSGVSQSDQRMRGRGRGGRPQERGGPPAERGNGRGNGKGKDGA